MLKILFKILLLLFGITSVAASASFAESGWYWQNPLPQGNPLRAVAVPDSKTVIAVGDFGTIMRTTTGGE